MRRGHWKGVSSGNPTDGGEESIDSTGWDDTNKLVELTEPKGGGREGKGVKARENEEDKIEMN